MAAKFFNNLPIKLSLENNRVIVQKNSVSQESDLNFDCKIEDAFDIDTGLSGDYYTLSVESSSDNGAQQNLKLFIKSLPLRYPIECSRVKHWKLFEREQIMYSIIDDVIKEKLNSHVNVCPRPYSITETFIVLENIKSLGFQSLDSIPITPEITKVCLEALANMHAQNIALVVSNNDQQYLQNDSPLKDPILMIENPWVQAGISAILKLAIKDSRNQSEKKKEFIEDQLASRINSIFDLTTLRDDQFKVICHCDLRPKNIYIKTDEKDPQTYTQCTFVDYQEARYVPPAIDVLLFLCYNLRKPIVTDAMVTEYCNYYYEKLNNACKSLNFELEKHLSLDGFHETVEQYGPLAKFMRALNATFLCDSRFASKLRINDIEEYINCMVLDRSLIIDKLCDAGTSIEQFLFESNQAVVELFDVE